MKSVSLQRLESQENEEESMDLSWIYHGFIHQNYGFPMVFRCFPADLSSAMLGFHVGK